MESPKVVRGDGLSAPSLCRTRKTPHTSATANISPIVYCCYMEGWQQPGKHANERTGRIPRDCQSQSSVAKMGFKVTGSKLLGFPHCSGGRTALPHVAFCLEERINEVFDVKTQMKANMTKFLFKLSLFTNILFWQSPPWAISAASSPSCWLCMLRPYPMTFFTALSQQYFVSNCLCKRLSLFPSSQALPHFQQQAESCLLHPGLIIKQPCWSIQSFADILLTIRTMNVLH